MLHFILGPSGSGKSYQMLAELRTRAERGERSILIVPEQFTSSTEGVLYRTLGDSLSAYVDSYSFTSLSEALLRRYGAATLLLSWMPVIGDLLCLLAGWMRISWGPVLFFLCLGKALRYIAVAALTLQGMTWWH